MKKQITHFIYTLLLVIFSTNAIASHMMGGELYYEALGNNKFLIRITLYQDCLNGDAGAISADNPAQLAIYANGQPATYFSSSSAELISTRIVPLEFSNECVSSVPQLCMRESIYEKTITLPDNSNGYTIVYQRCCRNNAIINIQAPGGKGVTYYATMPPVVNGTCDNKLASFNQQPPQIICKDNPFVYDFSVSDADGDSIVYKLCETFNGGSQAVPSPTGNQITGPPFSPIPFTFGFTANNPLPSIPPMSINESTGIITANPTSTGRFQVSVCVEEYRNGSLISTFNRDLQFYITNCSKNVVANTPLFSVQPNTYIINCSDYTVKFFNSSVGAYNYRWDFGDGSPQSTEEEPTHTYSDTGTYNVKLLINEGGTCSDSISRLVKIYPTFKGKASYTGLLCPNADITFTHEITNTYDVPYSILWDFGDGTTSTDINPTHSYTKGGNYTVQLISTSESGCNDTFKLPLKIIDFQPKAINDTVIVIGYPFNLDATGGQYYSWTPADYLSNPNIPNPSVSFPEVGTYQYYLDVTAEEGCKGKDTVNITVVPVAQILLPNAFSPNDDGKNDVFKPRIVGFSEVNFFRIYNRWGERVYVGYTAETGWNGTYKNKKAEAGVYFYEISIKKLDGTSLIQKGDVTLLR